jgi:pSer/pThr/pTyr-binding forkhead associated (FHA) protein
MITCPNCKHEELTGAIYCSECGAQLIEANLSTHKIKTAERKLAERTSETFQAYNPPISPSKISLNIVENGQILPLADRSEFTLGRSAEGQPIIPDVDLAPFDAYANGVSRLHAAIKIINNRIVITDLGSANGTYVNGARLTSYADTPVSHGDYIFLGKLKIQLLIS